MKKNVSFGSFTISAVKLRFFKMLTIASISFLLFTIFSYVVTEEKIETYSDKYDYINVDEILANPRLSESYYNCFMDLGPCVTADQKFLRGNKSYFTFLLIIN